MGGAPAAVAAAETVWAESRLALIPTMVVGSTAPPTWLTLIDCRLVRLDGLGMILPFGSASQPCSTRPALFTR